MSSQSSSPSDSPALLSQQPAPFALAADSEGSPDWRTRKRKRLPKSCIPCYQGRKACDRGTPCQSCLRRGQTENCKYKTESISNEHSPQVDRVRQLENEVYTLRATVYGSRPSPISPVYPINNHSFYPSNDASPIDGYLLQRLQPEFADQLPLKLENLSYASLPQDFPSLRGQIFGFVSAEGNISNEIYVHGAQAPELIDHINRHSKTDEPVVRVQYCFDVSQYSDRQEGYMQFMLSSVRKHPDPVARLLNLRPTPPEAIPLWNIYMAYVDVIFNVGDPMPLREQFCSFINSKEGAKPSNLQAAQFAAIMAVSMAFFGNTELESFSRVNDILDRNVLNRYQDMCPRHMACRHYLALCLSVLDNINASAVEVVHVELLCCIALFNMGALSGAKARFAVMLQRAVSMGLHQDPRALITEPYTLNEREIRLKLAFQIQHLDFVTSTCLGHQPISFDLFSFALESVQGLPEFCQKVLEAVAFAKEIYKTFFSSAHVNPDAPPPFESAQRLTERILEWRRRQPAEYQPPFNHTFAFDASPLYRQLNHEWTSVKMHETAYLTCFTSMLVLLCNRPYIAQPDARMRCLGAAHVMLQIVHHLKQQAPESRFLRRRAIWCWTCRACITLARGAMDAPSLLEKQQILNDLALAEDLIQPITRLSAVKNFECVIKDLNKFVKTL